MMTKDSNSVPSTLTPLSTDSRTRAYRPELGAAFEDRLGAAQQRLNRDDTRSDRKDEQKSDKRADKEERADNAREQQGTAKPARRFGEQQDQQGQDGRAPFEGLVQMAPSRLRGLEMVMPVSAPAVLDPALLAQLDRIAAAIAETLPNQVDKQMSVAFGKDDFAQGAVLTRDASGAISIHIAGLHPGVTAAQSVRLQQELRARLMAKKLEVREVAFTEALPRSEQGPPGQPIRNA